MTNLHVSIFTNRFISLHYSGRFVKKKYCCCLCIILCDIIYCGTVYHSINDYYILYKYVNNLTHHFQNVLFFHFKHSIHHRIKSPVSEVFTLQQKDKNLRRPQLLLFRIYCMHCKSQRHIGHKDISLLNLLFL